ncbi:MAG: DUF4440 domain-containing protein [Tatlockia sp.]|nr:DUF4440 domain-containing protein [Tatlockia sp.]
MNIDQVLESLIKREPIFHREEFGRSRDDFEKMMEVDFWEVGASGNIYTKEYVLETLEERYSKPYNENWHTKDFKCKALTENIYLLTYTLIQDNTRITIRSTVWKYENELWKIVYHQGTFVESSQT